MIRKTLAISAAALGLCLPWSCHKSSGGAAPKQKLTSILFLTRQEIAVGAEGLRSVLCEDFTGNGSPDLLVSSLIQKQIRYFAAATAGNFADAGGSGFDFTTAPTILRSGDFDGDKDRDFVAAFPSDGVLRIWRNDGAGAFTKDAKSLNISGAASSVEVHDLDGDGRDDILVTTSRLGQVRYFHASRSGFDAAQVFSLGATRALGGLASADLNGDGRLDFVVCDSNKNELLIWFGAASGYTKTQNLRLPVDAQGIFSAIASDLNGDGLLDLCAAGYGSGNIVVFSGDGKGQFSTGVKTAVDGNPFALTVGDLNADGRPDLVISYLDRAAVGVLMGAGNGKFAVERQFGTTGLPTMSRICDVDKDGKLDVLTSGLDASHLSWMRGLGAAGLSGSENFGTGRSTPNFTSSADFDGDGHADVIVSDRLGSVCSVLKGDADGRLSAPVFEANVGKLPGNMSKADFDRDGKMDIVVTVSDGLRFLLNRSTPGKIQFELWPDAKAGPYSLGAGPFEVATGRLDGDDVDDLVVTDYGGDRVLVLRALANGFGFQQKILATAVKGGPLSLVTGDFNRDGHVDCAVSRFRDGFVSILEGDGKGQLTVKSDLPTGVAPNYLRSADFDANGLPDFVVSNLGGNQLTLFLTKGAGKFESRALVVGQGPTALMARDLNFDGRPDILVANAKSADFYVLIGDGSGGFPGAHRFAGTFRALSADLGDVDGDGLLDLVIASMFTNRVSLYLNRSR